MPVYLEFTEARLSVGFRDDFPAGLLRVLELINIGKPLQYN